MKVVDSLADRRLWPRRSSVGLLVDSYKASGPFRGFLDFALFGGLVLFFLHPPELAAFRQALTPAGVGAPPTSLANQAPRRPTVASAMPGVVPGPNLQAILRATLEQFLGLSKPENVPALRNVIGFLENNRNDEALAALARIDATDPNTQFMRGFALLRNVDMVKAVVALRRAVDMGHPQAMYYLAMLIDGGLGARPDPVAVFDLLRRAYESGADEAGIKLVSDYYHGGKAGFRDYQKSLAISQRLADKGNPQAMISLGVHYVRGEGVASNPAKAAALFRKAADMGEPIAMFNLAQCYLMGHGVALDPSVALVWLQKAADLDYVPAYVWLAKVYIKGDVGPPDPVLAAQYLRKAAIRNDGHAQLLLGTLYEAGRGVSKDLVQAYLYYGLARTRGERTADQRLADVDAKLTDSERDRARRLLEASLPAKR